MQRIIWAYVYSFGGGIIFWTPSVALHAYRGYNFRGLDVLILTIQVPLMTIAVFVIGWILCLEKINRQFIARSMLLGIWALGVLFILAGGSFSTGVPLGPDGWKLLIMGNLLFPVFTFSMASYDGTLFALLLATFLLVLISEGSHVRFLQRLRLAI